MLSSHLPRAPYDKFVYDFLCNFYYFFGIVGSYNVHIVYDHRAISCTGPPGQAGINPYRGCTEIVRKSCNLSAVSVQSPQHPHGNHTQPVWLPCRGFVELVR